MISGADLVRALIRFAAPGDAEIRIGGLPMADPQWAIGITDDGGSRPEYYTFDVPRYVTDRVRIVVRDRYRDSEHDNRWSRSTLAALRERLERIRGDAVAGVEEEIFATTGQPAVPVSSSYPDVWCTEAGGPRWRIIPAGDNRGRTAGVEFHVAVKYRPERTRPAVSQLGPWDPASLPAGGQAAVVGQTEIPRAGAPGRVLAAGQVTCGAPVPRMLPPDPRIPTDGAAQTSPLTGREDGVLWFNARVGTETHQGVFDLFGQGGGDLTATLGEGGTAVEFMRADVLDATEQIRLRVSRYFAAAEEAHLAFFLQDHENPPHRYVFRLSEAERRRFDGEDGYLLAFVPQEKIEATDLWDWTLADLRRFRLDPVRSVLPPNPRWRLRWQLRWQGASGFLEPGAAGEDVLDFDGPRTRQLQLVEAQRPAGGMLEQVVTLESRDDPPLTRLQGYSVPCAAEGVIIHGEREPSGEAPPPAGQSQAHTAGFDEGFE